MRKDMSMYTFRRPPSLIFSAMLSFLVAILEFCWLCIVNLYSLVKHTTFITDPQILIIGLQTILYTIMPSEISIYWFLAAILDLFWKCNVYIPSLVEHLTCMRVKHHRPPNPEYRHSNNLICNQLKWYNFIDFLRPSWIWLDYLMCTLPLWWNISHESHALQTPSSRL